jgi:hypothetical protein
LLTPTIEKMILLSIMDSIDPICMEIYAQKYGFPANP